MESQTTPKEKLKFSEVYVSDIKILTTIFNQVSDPNSTDQKSFGVPFLLAKKEDKMVAFASLIVDKTHKIRHIIYDNESLDDKDKIIRQKLVQTVCNSSLYSDVITDFLEHGRYDHHLRTFRNKLYSNYLQINRAVESYFPDSTKISQPKGGVCCGWNSIKEYLPQIYTIRHCPKKSILRPAGFFRSTINTTIA